MFTVMVLTVRMTTRKLTRDEFASIVALALGDLSPKTAGSTCLSGAIYAALMHGLSRAQFVLLVDRTFETIETLGGLEADADAILRGKTN